MPWVKGSDKARAKYVKAKDIAEQYSLSVKQVYELLKRPEFEEAVAKFGDRKAIRVNLDRFYEISQQIFK